MISPLTKQRRTVKYLLPIVAILREASWVISQLANHDEPSEITVPEEKEDKAKKEKEKKKKSRLRRRGPYRKAHANW
jgi:hypothetical protein